MAIYIILAIAALLTSMISAILGMAGGILLLATMFCFMSHADSIPTHAAVQMASNGTRVLAFVRNVDRVAYGRFVLGALPGACIGMLLLWLLGQPEESEPYLKTIVGAFILFATFKPKRAGGGSSSEKWSDFPAIGLLAGTAALTVGTIDPLIAPTFARQGFVKERLIATKAICQLTIHTLKIPAFIWLRDLDLEKLGLLTLVMICMVIPGTLLGKRVVKNVSERHFKIAYKVALTFAGLKVLIFDGLLDLPIW
ncbi:MAG: sulfite exporter TauE/SafE family protein, partial [Planctomycetes bacterium]|nr:sulfite exporter TauE/SafE family protein [Planctomycetota bacterium]